MKATLEDSNCSGNPSIHQLSDPARRQVIQGGLGAGLALALGSAGSGCSNAAGALKANPAPAASGAADPNRTRLGFVGVPPGRADALVVPKGYAATVLAPWGTPVGLPGAMPPWQADAGNSAAEQAQQMGMHHDGLQFFPLPGAGGSLSARGLLVMNHEYVDDKLLHTDGPQPWTAEKARKSQAAHGLSVIEVELRDGAWQQVRPSSYARRVTATTPFGVGGPAAGHPMMQTAADPQGRRILGTIANCACGRTPWGTYLSGEENFNGYFSAGERADAHAKRWGLRPKSWSRWEIHDERFDAVKHPNEPNRFGWVVELDPFDPSSTPVKRTALGRAAHEGAWVAVTRDGRTVVYAGEDAAFEYIYKFVSRDRIAPGGAKANRTLLDHGILYVARFNRDGTGQWLPLVHNQGPLTAAGGFADQGEVLIKARQASDALGGTPMDRPEWLAINPNTGWVYCSLTHNALRGQAGKPGVDAANPRANDVMGEIIRWKEDGDFDGTHFMWNHLVLAGDPANARPEARGNIKGDLFACPDGLAFDPRGVLWIATDMGTGTMHQGELAAMGGNQLLACDPASGEVRRFLTGPLGCEVTGSAFSPDGTSLFVNIQHPGEPSQMRGNPPRPYSASNWPDGIPGGRPRAATVAIRRWDGGVIGM
jgi:uncharacterized protein